MIAAAKTSGSTTADAFCWHPTFLDMLPDIERIANVKLCYLRPEAREEAVQEVVCNACTAFVRLVEQGRENVATAISLAEYAVAQFRAGRRVGGELNVGDVCSVHCQRRKGVVVQQMCYWADDSDSWQDILVEDKRATPADLAASRIDVPAFLATLNTRDRGIAEKLAMGESTSEVAQIFGISSGRISQLRRELELAWGYFHGPAIQRR